jgi:hypothetical protein
MGGCLRREEEAVEHRVYLGDEGDGDEVEDDVLHREVRPVNTRVWLKGVNRGEEEAR